MMRWRVLFAGLCTLLALLALVDRDGELRISIDSSPAALGGQKLTGNIDRLALAVSRDGIFTLADIELIASFGQAVQLMPGVRGVHSLATVELPSASGQHIDVSPLITRLRQEPAKARAWIDQAMADPLVQHRLVSDDRRALAILIEIDAHDGGRSRQTSQDISELAQLSFAERGGLSWEISGAPLINFAVGQLLVRELSVILPLAILACALVLWAAFGSLALILANLVTVALAILWTLGSAAALGWNLNLITILVPPLVTALTVAYVMHVVVAYGDHGDLLRGLTQVRLALIITALTTMIGFAALYLNSLQSMREFAVLGAIGTLCAALTAETVLPPLLSLARRPPRFWPWLNLRLLTLGHRIANAAVHRGRWIIAAGLGLFGLSLLASLQVQPGTRYVQDLRPEHPERLAFESLNRRFGGSNSLNIELQGSHDEAMLDPAVLSAMDDLAVWLRTQAGVGAVIGLPDYVKRIHQAVHGDDPAAYRIPADGDVARQLAMLFGPADMYQLADAAFRSTRLVVTTPLVETAQLQELFGLIDQRLGLLPDGVTARLTGDAVQLTDTVNEITGGQLRSIVIAALAILILLSVLFGSLAIGLRAMLPNLLPIAIFFGLLGITGIPLGPTTALVACIVLGIAVDDTLHLLVRFHALARRHADEQRAARESVAEVIRPITLTTLSTSVGFLILGFSSFESQASFGLLAATTLLAAWVCDLALTPAISARTRVVTLWDRVRLNLGPDPQETIPLMAGLTRRQARTLALHSRIFPIDAGESLMREGDTGHDLFVVLDGEFEVSRLAEDGSTSVLAHCGRGTVFGESGYLGQLRSASVVATQAGRLMQFDASGLERLRRRDESIATLIRQNLTHLQSQRELINALDRPDPGSPGKGTVYSGKHS